MRTAVPSISSGKMQSLGVLQTIRVGVVMRFIAAGGMVGVVIIS